MQIAARGEDVGGVTGGEVLAGEDNRAAGGGDELENGAGEGGFSAAGFADEAEDFATGDVESDAVDGFDGADVAFEEETRRDREVRANVAKFEDGWGRGRESGRGHGRGILTTDGHEWSRMFRRIQEWACGRHGQHGRRKTEERRRDGGLFPNR